MMSDRLNEGIFGKMAKDVFPNLSGEEEDYNWVYLREVPGSNVVVLEFFPCTSGDIIGDMRFFARNVLRRLIDLGKSLVLNMENVAMTDSVFLGMLCDMTNQGIAPHGDIEGDNNSYNLPVLLNVGRSVKYLLFVTKLDQLFCKFDDREEAIKFAKTF